MTREQQLMKDIFNMVYQWGRMDIDVDYKAHAYQTAIYDLLGKDVYGYHKGGVECRIPKCRLKLLPF